jgi:hypothetical protein
MSLNILYDFMKVLNSIRIQYTRNAYFLQHIVFTMIYSLQEHKLNHNK